jgi:hypothetical protein
MRTKQCEGDREGKSVQWYNRPIAILPIISNNFKSLTSPFAEKYRPYFYLNSQQHFSKYTCLNKQATATVFPTGLDFQSIGN